MIYYYLNLLWGHTPETISTLNVITSITPTWFSNFVLLFSKLNKKTKTNNQLMLNMKRPPSATAQLSYLFSGVTDTLSTSSAQNQQRSPKMIFPRRLKVCFWSQVKHRACLIECRSSVWFNLRVTAAESFTVKKILVCIEIKSVRSASVSLRVKNRFWETRFDQTGLRGVTRNSKPWHINLVMTSSFLLSTFAALLLSY